MTAFTITRAFNNTSSLINSAKAKDNSWAYGVKKFFYSIITLGLGKSMENARAERREKEAVHVAFDTLDQLPENYSQLEEVGFSKTIHTNFDKKYQIVQEGKELCIYTGNISQSMFTVTGKTFNRNETSRSVLKQFNHESEFENFKNDLNPIKENKIYKDLEQQQQQQQQQQAATTIQAGVRRLQSIIRIKQENQYGFKKLEYTSKHSNSDKTFLFSKNLNSFTVPKINIDGGGKGAFKQVVGKDEHSVLFSRSNHLNPEIKKLQHPWSSHGIEKVLNDQGITTFKVTHQISDDQEIAHNAGPDDLYNGYAQKNKIMDVEHFKPILLDMKKLHLNGYFHLDIKSDNIQVRMVNDKPILSVIDLDSFSSINKCSLLSGTQSFTTTELHIQCFPNAPMYNKGQLGNKPPPKETLLQTFDEFAFAVTMLEATRNYNSSDDLFNKEGLNVTDRITKFINKKIKPEYQNQFIQLITRPGTYAKTYLDNNTAAPIYLVDMLA
jgi:hypothetical protein